MSLSEEPKKVRNEFSVTVKTGFHCTICNWETITFDESIPKECPHCHATDMLRQSWKNRITTTVKVEVL